MTQFFTLFLRKNSFVIEALQLCFVIYPYLAKVIQSFYLIFYHLILVLLLISLVPCYPAIMSLHQCLQDEPNIVIIKAFLIFT